MYLCYQFYCLCLQHSGIFVYVCNITHTELGVRAFTHFPPQSMSKYDVLYISVSLVNTM